MLASIEADTFRLGHKARLGRAHEEPQGAQRRDRLSSVICDPTVNCELSTVNCQL